MDFMSTRNTVSKTVDFLCIGMSIQPLVVDQPVSIVSVGLGKSCDKINGSY
mgnify:CR=1 FL=1